MQFLALIVFIIVAFCGVQLLKRKISNKQISRWMVRAHGLGGVVGLILLIIGLFKGMYWSSSWGWISVALFATLLVFGFMVLGKWGKLFNGRKKPTIVIIFHGCFACICIGVLTYSLVMVN